MTHITKVYEALSSEAFGHVEYEPFDDYCGTLSVELVDYPGFALEDFNRLQEVVLVEFIAFESPGSIKIDIRGANGDKIVHVNDD